MADSIPDASRELERLSQLMEQGGDPLEVLARAMVLAAKSSVELGRRLDRIAGAIERLAPRSSVKTLRVGGGNG